MVRSCRLMLAVLLAVSLVGRSADGAARAQRAASPVAARAPSMPTYAAPISPLTVVTAFDPPVTRYGPGHLGVDLAAASGAPVRAAADGVVRFAGPVAGRGVVVVAHADGVTTEYEPLRPTVRAGVAVRLGDVLGRLEGVHRGCAERCLHWGARRAGRYLNPLSLLRPLGPVRLLPWNARDG